MVADLIRRKSRLKPAVAVVLGSGFRTVEALVEVDATMSYAQIPGFCSSSVAGHAGRLLVGTIADAPTLVFSGRAHYYEGHSLVEAGFPVRVAAALGAGIVLLTNAAGGINRRYCPGDFMVLEDHINLMGENPLRGTPADGQRFVDLSQAYDPDLRVILENAVLAIGAVCHSGVYLAVSGPSYETPAEIRAFSRLGADAVGMSTVPEAIVARQCGLRVAGLSMITNPAAGRSRTPITHNEVLEIGQRAGGQAGKIIESFVRTCSANGC